MKSDLIYQCGKDLFVLDTKYRKPTHTLIQNKESTGLILKTNINIS